MNTPSVPFSPSATVAHPAEPFNSAPPGRPVAGPHAGRNISLDMLRAVLVLAVLAYHYTIRWTQPDYPVDLYGFEHVYSRHWSIGAFGVHLFFVISGYVITISVLRSRSAWKFATSRFLRIYPGLLIAALLAFACAWLVGPTALRASPADLATTLILLPTEFHQRYVDGAFWTLTVEAKFYAFVALGFAIWRERFWRLLLIIGLVGPIIYPFMRGVGDKLLISPFIGLFLIGMSIWFAANAKDMRTAALLGLTGAFGYAMNYATIGYDGRVSIVLHALLIGGMLLIYLMARFDPDLRVPVLPYLGKISYEIYLVHQVIGVAIIGHAKRMTGQPDIACIAVAVGGSIALAAIVHHHLTPPVRRWFAGLLKKIDLRRSIAPVGV